MTVHHDMGWQGILLWTGTCWLVAAVLIVWAAKRREKRERHWSRRRAPSGWQNTDFRDSLARWNGNNATFHNSRMLRSSRKWSGLP